MGFADVVADKVFHDLVLARVLEPTSEKDSLRVLDEAGVAAVSYPTLKRHLPKFAAGEFRAVVASACAARAGVGPAALAFYDVTTLCFETDEGDGFREPGFSKERRLEPQITVGLLTDRSGMPLTVDAFEGNKAETKTMIPVVKSFTAAHGISGVTVVADAGMLSEANPKDVEDAGWSLIVGGRPPEVPYQAAEWQRAHPGQQPAGKLVLSQPTPMGPKADQRRRTTCYQYKLDRAKRALHGIDAQIGKAEKAVAGKAPVKRNRFVVLEGARKPVNRQLEAKARALAGWKSYVTNLNDADPAFVIGAHHELWHVERAFKMSKHDLRARPIYHHKQESTQAHLTIVFAALAISRWLEQQTGWTIKRLVKTPRRYRTDTIRVGNHTFQAQPDIPDDIRDLLQHIT
ncbi:MAG: IS1634 family transposase [Propionibacteriaceae bacterium]|nr:IS1634 family transposase [Propionibacteriaceae bacterium]